MLRLPNHHPAVKAFRRKHNIRHGVDETHTCCLEACAFSHLPNTHFYFCRASLHVHVCSPAGCPLSKRHDNSGVFTCPLTGIEMKARDFVQQETIKVHGRGGMRFMQAGIRMSQQTPRRTCRRAKQNVVTPSVVAAVIANMIENKQSSQISTSAAALRILKRHSSFSAVVQHMAAHCALFTDLPPPPPGLVRQIVAYADRVYTKLVPLPTPTVFTAVCISLLQSGFTARGVVIFPVVAWAKATAPALTSYARLKNVQCRAMSICTRALKSLVFANGVISPVCIFEPL